LIVAWLGGMFALRLMEGRLLDDGRARRCYPETVCGLFV